MMQATSTFGVLEPVITFSESQESSVARSLRAAWKAFVGIRSQLLATKVPHKDRFALLCGLHQGGGGGSKGTL